MRTPPWTVLLPCLYPALGGAMNSPSPDNESPLPASFLFPEADGALRPGAFASLGLGVDNAR